MSRSRKKAIWKDRGRMKSMYWKIHRRVNKQIVKHFFESARHRISYYNNWDDFFEFKRIFMDKGYSEEEAHQMAYHEIEDNEDFPICSNCHIDWAEEPEVIYPKQLINDWDYSDYTIKNEFLTKDDMWEYSDTGMCLDEESHREVQKKQRRK